MSKLDSEDGAEKVVEPKESTIGEDFVRGGYAGPEYADLSSSIMFQLTVGEAAVKIRTQLRVDDLTTVVRRYFQHREKFFGAIDEPAFLKALRDLDIFDDRVVTVFKDIFNNDCLQMVKKLSEGRWSNHRVMRNMREQGFDDDELVEAFKRIGFSEDEIGLSLYMSGVRQDVIDKIFKNLDSK